MLHELAVGLAEALTIIHAAGVVHRDLKPSNVILTVDGPKIIDFGIAQALDSAALTQPGMTVGSAGFMAPEQVMGHAGPAAAIFAWAVPVAYAATGRPPFGTGAGDAIMYRTVHAKPSIAAVPEALRSVIEAALAKEPHNQPAAHEILDQLTDSWAAPVLACGEDDTSTQPVPLPTSPPTEPRASQPEQREKAKDQAPARAAPALGTGRPGTRQRLASRRKVAVPTLVVMVAAALSTALPIGHGVRVGELSGNQRLSSSRPLAAGPFGIFPGQQDRGVFQTVSRIVASGRTIVTTGAQVSDGGSAPAVLRLGRRRRHLASPPGPGAGRRSAPAGVPGHAAGGRPRSWVAIGTAARRIGNPAL